MLSSLFDELVGACYQPAWQGMYPQHDLPRPEWSGDQAPQEPLLAQQPRSRFRVQDVENHSFQPDSRMLTLGGKLGYTF